MGHFEANYLHEQVLAALAEEAELQEFSDLVQALDVTHEFVLALAIQTGAADVGSASWRRQLGVWWWGSD